MSTESPKALLSFKLGPVQPFIESARTVRDLWTGSYLLSWLAAAAMKPVLEAGGSFITPHVDDENPLLRAMHKGIKGDQAAMLACLPHTFAAEVPEAQAETIRQACLRDCLREWMNIADAVKSKIQKTLDRSPGWDRDWNDQIKSFFEFQCVVLPLALATPEKLKLLKVKTDESQEKPENQFWSRQWNLLGALMDVARSVRHVPMYAPQSDHHGRFSVKCNLLGSLEQMGPAEFKDAEAFWDAVTSPAWKGLEGTRLQSSDKLCAVGLVKRFAWPAYLRDRLGLHVRDRRYADTATVAAKEWLIEGLPLDPEELREDDGAWNGQWLHWIKNDQGERDGEQNRPEKVERLIREKVAAQKRRPPTYYAILHMDGDSMGDFFQGDKGREFGEGAARYRKITKRLTTFSLHMVSRIVEECYGELIYAGGDDILAILPTLRATECAQMLHAAFLSDDCLKAGASLSGGIAVVHYKEDLRFALQQARDAEKAAKRIAKAGTKGRLPDGGDPNVKNALAVTVCRRSGEHTTAVMGWDQADLVMKLVRSFAEKKATDRWAYKLRSELPTLRALPLEAGKAEALRLVAKTQAGGSDSSEGRAFKQNVETLFDRYRDEMQSANRNWRDADVLEGFVTLCQSASFLARGRE